MAAMNQIGIANLTVSTSAVALVIPSGFVPKRALIYVATSPIRWTALVGTPPTSTLGMFVAAGNYIDWTTFGDEEDHSGLIRNARFIRDTSAGSDATLAVALFS